MSKKLSLTERMQNFTKKVKDTDERWAIGVDNFSKKVKSFGNAVEASAKELNKEVEEARRLQKIEHGARLDKLKADNPDVNWKAIEEELKY